MTDPNNNKSSVDSIPKPPDQPSARKNLSPPLQSHREWWLKLLIKPMLFFAAGILLIIVLGIAQKSGFLSTDSFQQAKQQLADASTRYICPMMCTPPLSEPGRCPVCGMNLVPVSGNNNIDPTAVMIDPVARRVANIQTVAVTAAPQHRIIRAVGGIQYNEGTLKTISAYVDGRLDRLYADFTGIKVNAGDKLALLYSPQLYSGQVELLLAKKSLQESQNATLERVLRSNERLYESAKQRLIELGMTANQIAELEKDDQADSRLRLVAPMSGTVIEKHAVEGEYVKVGEAIYKLADLSSVWLMLQLFPEDAALIRYGQQVEATVQSLPGKIFKGRVAFVDPNVDPQTRTVSVRVVIPNKEEELRIGDYAKAQINVPFSIPENNSEKIYDPELANKWISPRHPHVIQDTPGKCPICGVDLISASELGFTDHQLESENALVIPREAVLMAGSNSVVYVETKPGRFEIRPVVLGQSTDDNIAILKGLKLGEKVATRGNFLIDSQMQLVGNPSIIDPTRAKATPSTTPKETKLTPEIIAALSKLSDSDQKLAESQRICPVAGMPLGSMGTPKKLTVEGEPVFICCESCRERLLNDPQKYLKKIPQRESNTPDSSESGKSSTLKKETQSHKKKTHSHNVPPIQTSQEILPETSKAESKESH